jgi:hypothetical protein
MATAASEVNDDEGPIALSKTEPSIQSMPHRLGPFDHPGGLSIFQLDERPLPLATLSRIATRRQILQLLLRLTRYGLDHPKLTIGGVIVNQGQRPCLRLLFVANPDCGL